MNRATFFARVRGPLFNGRLTPDQVRGIDLILDEAQKRRTPIHWLAYMLATAYHEVDRTMQPIREYGRGRGKLYGKPTKHGGQIAYGRGLVQLTWDYNYENADKELGLGGRLIRDYDLALDPVIAVQIMFSGMEKGWFTGRRLTTVTGAAPYREWRRIINGLDDADLIASYAMRFEAALNAAGYGTALDTSTAPVAPVAAPPAPVIAPPPIAAPPAPAPTKPGLWSRLLSNWKSVS